MAKPELMIKINLEPSEETIQISKQMLEMWLNAYYGRDILVKERDTNEGQEIYLELVEENDTSESI